MINFMSSWAEQIVLAVIVATIIEMILPKNKNKKYIQMVIGVYVLFNIISPIIKNKDDFSIEKYNIENYENNFQYEVDQTSMNKKLEKIYLEELEQIVISRFEENNYEVVKCNIDAELDSTKKNAGIHSITVKIQGGNSKKDADEIKREIAEELEIEGEKITIKT
ncbi:MAG: stage III sporulation protein AF [Clostridia bacterium]|nr:stage III sporulation protein AF [Clostridia bacterium]